MKNTAIALLVSALIVQPPTTAQDRALEDTRTGPPTSPPTFQEVPGEFELRGVLNARPLQVEDAARYSLSPGEVTTRRARAKALLSAYSLVEYVEGTDEYLIEVGEGNEQEVAEALMAGGDFQYVTPDWLCFPIANCTTDSNLPSQWHHNANRMNSCDGWALETGSPGTVVAICDTGVRTTHSDLALHRMEGYNAVSNLWESQGGDINDINGHGTATTGCAAANGDNGIGVSGTAWNLGHRMMRVTNSSGGGAYMSDLTQAARLASDVGDKAASVSYGGVTDPSVQTAGNYVRNNGALLVWAAGNSGTNMGGSREDSVIVVGATNSGDNKTSWSSYGSFMDLVAPGEGIYTTSNNGNNSYSSVSGTSFSCPLTAGLCCLIFARDPNLTAQEAEDILRAGCDDLGSSGVDNSYGYGRIDTFGSLSLIQGCGAETYCTSLTNSSGFEATMSYSGSTSIASNDLSLAAGICPDGQFGLFFFGDQQASTVSGGGILCVGGNLIRLPVTQTDFIGFAYHNFDLDNLPPAAPTIQPGDVTNISFWFREKPGTPGNWNFAGGLSVTWCN